MHIEQQPIHIEMDGKTVGKTISRLLRLNKFFLPKEQRNMYISLIKKTN